MNARSSCRDPVGEHYAAANRGSSRTRTDPPPSPRPLRVQPRTAPRAASSSCALGSDPPAPEVPQRASARASAKGVGSSRSRYERECPPASWLPAYARTNAFSATAIQAVRWAVFASPILRHVGIRAPSSRRRCRLYGITPAKKARSLEGTDAQFSAPRECHSGLFRGGDDDSYTQDRDWAPTNFLTHPLVEGRQFPPLVELCAIVLTRPARCSMCRSPSRTNRVTTVS